MNQFPFTRRKLPCEVPTYFMCRRKNEKSKKFSNNKLGDATSFSLTSLIHFQLSS